MSALRPPSVDIPEGEKQAFTEAEVHSKLFEPDMVFLGYPPRTNNQAHGEYFREQRTLAMRRLKSGRERGHYDGLYLVGNSPVVLCEIKRYEMLDTPAKFDAAAKQLQDYARSEDFEQPPPFLLLYCGKPERTRFYRLRNMAEGTVLDSAVYDEQPEIWSWGQVREAHVRGAFAEEVVDSARLLEILLHHLDQIEDDLRAPLSSAVELVASATAPALLSPVAQWLQKHPQARRRFGQLYQRKIAELGDTDRQRVAEEMVTQAALNQLNKVFFLNLCEDRSLPGFYRIMREFLPTSRTEATPTEAAVFLGLLRRKIEDSAGRWRDEDERAYRELRVQLTPEIGSSVIEQNNWWELIRVAFDLAGERFPLVYRDDAYDYFKPKTASLADLIFDLSTKSFRGLKNRDVGDIYQSLLSSRRTADDPGPRRRRQSKLGAFYTPEGDVDYMISQLDLRKGSRVLDPCMGSGHFLEGIYEALRDLYVGEGHAAEDVYRQVIGQQIFGGDIDTFAASLSAIRMFLLDEHETKTAPNLFVHDMLLHTPERPASELFSAESLASGTGAAVGEADQEVDELQLVDEIEFDAVVGNPPYGAKKPAYKERIYRSLYGSTKEAIAKGSRGTGDADSYAMFIASGIERLREGGRLCFITNDSFRTLTTHSALRRLILDRCKVIEILLTDTKHFEGVSFQFAGMAITTLEKCSDAAARQAHEIRLVDYVRDPKDFPSPPPEKVSTLRQEEYEAFEQTPFFVGVPRDMLESAKGSGKVRDVARGRQGLATADDQRFLAGIGAPVRGLPRVVDGGQVTACLAPEYRKHGAPPQTPSWVPFAKGEGFSPYWRSPRIAIDWSQASVAELRLRDRLPARSARKPRLQNEAYYFQAGLTYPDVGAGPLSARLLPEGWIFSHKGSAVFVEDGSVDELFLLAYLNSSLATYFMKKLVNATATASLGYVEKLPFRRPSAELQAEVVANVEQIIAALQANPDTDIQPQRAAIDERIFDLFEIGASRELVRDFYRTVGRAEPAAAEEDATEPQAAIE